MATVVDGMKWYADCKRWDIEFQVGDLVFFKMSKEKFKPPVRISYSLMRLSEGPFEILEKRYHGAYKLKLTESLKTIHLVGHMS